MWLFIDVDQDAKTGWEGYDFVVNRTVAGDGRSCLEQHAGGWQWDRLARVDYRVDDCRLHLAVPRAALGPKADALAFDFKWVDNVQRPGDIMDFYLSGDVAPEGRFAYRYNTK
jgi:hypothetical protein